MLASSPRRLLRVLVLAFVAILIALGWTQRHRFAPIEKGSLAPAYSAPALDGQPVALADFKGKVVLLNVWATWCRPCVQEMPALERIFRELAPEGLAVVAVSVDAPVGGFDSMGNAGGDIRAFVREYDLSFTILHDARRRVQPLFGLFGLPTTVVIDRSGRIVRKAIGIEAWDDEPHRAELRALLARPS
ncbi:MAG: peroxiredoxin family protein [Longimicrobiales bacterium]